ncbi:hypothetical protein PENSPDRAFT_754178 [Peniophora sp. CONT]|nr:hypothetical protein PENSPDRAFT_754178 [Peniophora sp. CONT]
MSASLITRLMLNLRDIRTTGTSRQLTTDDPFLYDTPNDTDAAPLSTLVLGAEFINYALQFIPAVILYYDYFLTLGDEIANYWPPRRPLTWLSGLFLATRYVALLGHVPVVAAMIDLRLIGLIQGCHAPQTYHQFLELVLQIPIGCLCALRVYALYSKDRRILIGLGVLAGTLLVVATYLVVTSDSTDPLFYWQRAPLCTHQLSSSGATRLALAWSSVLLFDIVVFVLTAIRAFQVWQAGRVVHVVLRDGVVYICALAGANLLNIVTLLVATPLLKATFASLTNVLSVTLISRLMLNLRSDTTPDLLTTSGDAESTSARVDLDSIIVSHIETRRSMTRPRERHTRERSVNFDDDIELLALKSQGSSSVGSLGVGVGVGFGFRLRRSILL